MPLIKKCRHGRGLRGADRQRAWEECGCAWRVSQWDPVSRTWSYENVGTDRAAAERRMLALSSPGEGDSLAAVSERYIEALAKAGRAKRTIDQYRIYQRRAEDWFKPTFPITRVDTSRLEDYRQDLLDEKLDPDYAKHLVEFVRAVVQHALRERIPGVDRVPDLAPPIVPLRRDKADRLLTIAECERLVAALEVPWRAAGELILLTGLRIGELMALVPEVVDIAEGVLRVEGTLGRDGKIGPPKTASSRRPIDLSPRARSLVAARLLEAKPGERLWPGKIEGANRGAMRRALKASGLAAKGRGWHLLRHGHRDLLEASGVSVRDAAAQLGHGHQFATTEAYGWSAERAAVGAKVDAFRLRHAASPSA